MKKLAVFGLLALAGCIDLTQYISFNDKGRTVGSLRVGFSTALLEGFAESPLDSQEIMDKLSEVTNSLLAENFKDSNVTTTQRVISNAVRMGVETHSVAPKHYFSPEPSNLFPTKENYGFSLYMGPGFEESYKKLTENEPNREAVSGMAGALFTYTIILSKADLPRPLESVILNIAEGSVNAPFYDYGGVYLIEVPSAPLMLGAKKIEFHFSKAPAKK